MVTGIMVQERNNYCSLMTFYFRYHNKSYYKSILKRIKLLQLYRV